MKKLFLLFIFSFFLSPNFAQGVAINTNGDSADPSAILDIESTNSGLLLPRMTTAQRDSIVNPAHSLIIFNTTIDCFEAFNSDTEEWIAIGCIGEEPEPEFTCGDNFTDYRDNKTYTSVKIGNQCWMKKNLNYETSNSLCYNNNSNNCDLYGRLYTWDEAMAGATSSTSNPSGVQGVCPAGWHLPSDAEWTELTDYLGGISVAGGKLKETGTTHWQSPNTGATNETGFTALPGGYRSSSGYFDDLGLDGSWWSATEIDSSDAWKRSLYYGSSNVYRYDSSKDSGFSVRCVRD